IELITSPAIAKPIPILLSK
ncbi:unnamed protein product, partial [Rotaria sordida]